MNIAKEMPKELVEAMDRVIAKERMELSSLLNYILNLKTQKDELTAISIFASKEIEGPETDQDIVRNPLVSRKNELVAEIDELQGALVNHKLVRDTLQRAAFNIEMQDTVNSSLQNMEAENLVDAFPEKGFLLSQYSTNLDTCKTLVSTVQEKEEMEKEILQLRMNYINLLKKIKDKWDAVDDSLVSAPDDSEAVEQFQNKLREREAKLQILVTMLQCLISTSGFMWGAENYYIQVLLLCDIAATRGDKAELDATIAELSRYHEKKERGSEIKRKRQIYFTSTPARSKK